MRTSTGSSDIANSLSTCTSTPTVPSMRALVPLVLSDCGLSVHFSVGF
jgi:hypothetical protein